MINIEPAMAWGIANDCDIDECSVNPNTIGLHDQSQKK